MEPRPNNVEADPRQEALEDAAFTAWQFAAAFQGIELGREERAIRPPVGEQWEQAHESVRIFGIEPEEVVELAEQYFGQTIEALYPDGHLEFFQKIRQQAIRNNRKRKARFAIRRAVSKRMFLNE